MGLAGTCTQDEDNSNWGDLSLHATGKFPRISLKTGHICYLNMALASALLLCLTVSSEHISVWWSLNFLSILEAVSHAAFSSPHGFVALLSCFSSQAQSTLPFFLFCPGSCVFWNSGKYCEQGQAHGGSAIYCARGLDRVRSEGSCFCTIMYSCVIF